MHPKCEPSCKKVFLDKQVSSPACISEHEKQKIPLLLFKTEEGLEIFYSLKSVFINRILFRIAQRRNRYPYHHDLTDSQEWFDLKVILLRVWRHMP